MQKLIFCSSGKTLGHYIKTDYLYHLLKSKYNCVEITNPTECVLPILDKFSHKNKNIYFANDSFSNVASLSSNVDSLEEMLNQIKPSVVFGDKLPNLMTACYKKHIPYVSISHISQISHNWEFIDNPNLSLFNSYWETNNLNKPVSDPSWFFYRNWGNLILFADEKPSDFEKLNTYGYKYNFIGNIAPVLLPNTKNDSLIKLLEMKKYSRVVLFTMSSYSSDYSDEVVLKISKLYPTVLFIYPRNKLSIKINDINLRPNIYINEFISYSDIKKYLDLVFCLPGNGTLAAFSDFKNPIVGLYVHAEQKINASRFENSNFKYYKFDDSSFKIINNYINEMLKSPKNIYTVKEISDNISIEKDNRILSIIDNFISSIS